MAKTLEELLEEAGSAKWGHGNAGAVIHEMARRLRKLHGYIEDVDSRYGDDGGGEPIDYGRVRRILDGED